jgi:hypothetical protein
VGSKSKTKPTAKPVEVAAMKTQLGIRWATLPLSDQPITPLIGPSSIGRDEENETRIDGSEVSRWHAKVILKVGAPHLIDEFQRPDGSRKSTNGCFVNGRKVVDPVPLRVGDVVRLGQWVGVVCMIPDPDPGFRELGAGLLAGPWLAASLEKARRFANTDLSVLLIGETGTGKERVARAIHEWAKRRADSFIAVNCAELEKPLADSELFGHVRGAFTGADRDKPGLFRAANGGTLFLDEIVELPLAVQAKLLRVLQEGEVRPVGAATPVKVKVQVIAATQKPLEHFVE